MVANTRRTIVRCIRNVSWKKRSKQTDLTIEATTSRAVARFANSGLAE
jgi:hypothetical protein